MLCNQTPLGNSQISSVILYKDLHYSLITQSSAQKMLISEKAFHHVFSISSCTQAFQINLNYDIEDKNN